MKFLERQAAIGASVLLLSVLSLASHSHLALLDKRHSRHQHLHNLLHMSPREEHMEEEATPASLQKRDQCKFPTGAGLVAVTPGSANAGWAMSPDQPCLPGSYCPYACPPGQLMAQWDPSATSYTYPLSMNGGLRCDSSGAISKPFPDKPYCTPGTGAVAVKNTCGKVHAVCQTVLPGNEAMIIPTEVTGTTTLAVPGPDYWCSTASHFYHNPPGISIEEGCIWGDGSKPIGNWSPYVSGANTDSNGNTFAKVGWNPIYIASSFGNTLPNWGLKFECSECIGMPCSIDPLVNKMNEATSSDAATGAGGANFCVVTIPKGVTANIVVFEVGGSSSSRINSKSSTSAREIPSPSPTTTSLLSTTSSTSSSSSSSTTTTSSSTSLLRSSSQSPVGSTTSLPSANLTSSSAVATISVEPHVLFENRSSTTSSSSVATTTFDNSISTAPTTSRPSATSSKSAVAEILVPRGFGITALFVAAMAFSWL